MVEQNLEYQQIFNTWKVFHMDSLEVIRVESIHSIHEKKWRFLKFLHPVVDISANGEQQLKKGKNCRLMITLCSPWTWDSWLCDSPTKVCVKQHLCNPWVRFWGSSKDCKVSQLVEPPLCVHSFSTARVDDAVLLRNSLRFDKSSLLLTTLDRSSRVLLLN